jgi:2-C-methyl-D-erythritol 2,4-cyclodiphosphate synthase
MKPLILGGVRVDEKGGLEANSDGDVILHALFNAISQACGGHRGITDSTEYLKIALGMVKEIGYRVYNIGIMVEAAKPRISVDRIEEMKRSIADLIGVGDRDVGITFTSGEGLTSFGRGEGVLAQAVVSLMKG